MSCERGRAQSATGRRVLFLSSECSFVRQFVTPTDTENLIKYNFQNDENGGKYDYAE